MDNKMYQKEWVKCKIMSVKRKNHIHKDVQVMSRGESEVAAVKRHEAVSEKPEVSSASRITRRRWQNEERETDTSEPEARALCISHSGNRVSEELPCSQEQDVSGLRGQIHPFVANLFAPLLLMRRVSVAVAYERPDGPEAIKVKAEIVLTEKER